MTRGSVDVTIIGAVARDGASPVSVAWRVPVGPADTRKTIAAALRKACRALETTLRKELLP